MRKRKPALRRSPAASWELPFFVARCSGPVHSRGGRERVPECQALTPPLILPGGPMPPRVRELLSTFDPDLPLERARTIPSSWYREQEIYDVERRAVFGDAWLVAGRLADVAEPGSFVTTDLAGEPILVVRGPDG